MQNVNWWLMALSFLLGLVLTLFLVIRRVKREVPEYGSRGAGAAAAGAAGFFGGSAFEPALPRDPCAGGSGSRPGAFPTRVATDRKAMRGLRAP